MTDREEKIIDIPEICRVEGHSAVKVEIVNNKVENVTLDVFEGTRFFEQIVLNHHFEELPHITSRVCAICSTGHVLAAAFAIESILNFSPTYEIQLLRELMHLGMIIESHSTHIYALALPDFIGSPDLMDFATNHSAEFSTWTKLRKLGSAIQTIIGGRPFHPINLHVGGLSHLPAAEDLKQLLDLLRESEPLALNTCEMLLGFQPATPTTTTPDFLALIPQEEGYGYFGDTVISSAGWQESIQNYQKYLDEIAVPYSHAKRSSARGKPMMVGAMARLHHFANRLSAVAKPVFDASDLARGDTNTVLNNFAQSIEVVEAIIRAQTIITNLLNKSEMLGKDANLQRLQPKAGLATGAVECPRGTLYHSYRIDETGKVLKADMITPSAQNTHRIELDIKEVVDQLAGDASKQLQANLETLVRAYDPCNTCATHMVSVTYKQ